jgi:hypothetical protein
MLRTLSLVSASLMLSACASIFNGQTQSVVIQSTPTGADMVVSNAAGEQVHAGVTPVTLTLRRSGGYFRPESYTIKFTKAGHAPKEVVITGTMSGWYIGNLLFGGLIGMLAVDPATGGMFVFPDTVNPTLEVAAPSGRLQRESGLTIVSLDSLSPEMRAMARPVSH